MSGSHASEKKVETPKEQNELVIDDEDYGVAGGRRPGGGNYSDQVTRPRPVGFDSDNSVKRRD